MRGSAQALAFMSVLAVHCTGGQTGDEGVRGVPGKGGHPPPSSNGNFVPCSIDDQCRMRLESWAGMFAMPVTLPRTFVGAECRAAMADANCGRRPFCACAYRQDSAETTSQMLALGVGLNADCDLYGRDGKCLLPASDFAGCNVDDAQACETECKDALAAWAEDDARTLAVRARYAACVHEACRFVIEVEGACHPTGGVAGPVYDCSLDDTEILARAFPEPSDGESTPQCSAGQGCEQGLSLTELMCSVPAREGSGANSDGPDGGADAGMIPRRAPTPSL